MNQFGDYMTWNNSTGNWNLDKYQNAFVKNQFNIFNCVQSAYQIEILVFRCFTGLMVYLLSFYGDTTKALAIMENYNATMFL